MKDLFENHKYINFTDVIDELKNEAIRFMASYHTINTADKNFFEMVAILPALYDDNYIDKEWVKAEREEVRKQVACIRHSGIVHFQEEIEHHIEYLDWYFKYDDGGADKIAVEAWDTIKTVLNDYYKMFGREARQYMSDKS